MNQSKSITSLAEVIIVPSWHKHVLIVVLLLYFNFDKSKQNEGKQDKSKQDKNK